MHNSKYLKTFQYLGSKFSVLPFVLPFINIPVKHRIDVCGGSAVALLNCKQAPIETYNDVNNKIVNFFKVLRDSPDELIRRLELTPHSYREYKDAWDMDSDNDVERARKFFVRCVQSIYAAGAQDDVKGWASSFNQSRCTISEKTNKWVRSVENLWEVAERFKKIQIECRDFRFILKKYDGPDVLFYIDAPYEDTLRSGTRYEFDFGAQDWHDVHYWTKACKAKVVISGYDTPFMREMFSNFYFHQGPQRKNPRSDKIAMESVWCNFDINLIEHDKRRER